MRLVWKGLATGVAALALSASAVSGRALRHAHDDADASAASPTITVFKSPTCGCCKGWVEHLRKHGYHVVARDIADVSPIKTAHGVPEKLRTCHTALVGGYVVEGHVPADVIARLLKERPKVAGIGVAGMPAGSPGMEMPGTAPEHFDVIAFDKAGRTSVYARR